MPNIPYALRVRNVIGYTTKVLNRLECNFENLKRIIV